MKIFFPHWIENLAAPEGEGSYLSAEDLKGLGHPLSFRNLKTRESLFREGDLPQGIFGVTKGSFYLSKLGIEGQEQILDLALPGALLGLRALAAGESYSANAVARENSSVCFYEGTVFMNLLEEKPSLARAVLAKMGRQLREAREELLERSVASVSSRLAHWLLHVEGMYRSQDRPAWISGRELAGMVGASPESISRNLKIFLDAGLIERKGRFVKILNYEDLGKKVGDLSMTDISLHKM